MKFLLARLLIVLVFVFAAFTIQAQKQGNTTTIILVRHAEKDTAKINDPGLTTAGKLRALKLSTIFPNAKPDEMYSTAYIRTRETLAPWSKATGVMIKEYNAANQPELADLLKQQKGKTIVVVGHSNTIPQLVNLLINTDKYKSLDDTVYNKIFVVTINKGKAKVKVIDY